MMDVSRRSFLGGALTLIAATQLPAAAFASAPTIYGDGFHDDTAGIRAALAGEPFVCAQKGMVIASGGSVLISGGTFRFTDTLDLGAAKVSSSIVGAHLDFKDMPRDRECGIDLRGARDDVVHRVEGCHLIGNGHSCGVMMPRGSAVSRGRGENVWNASLSR